MFQINLFRRVQKAPEQLLAKRAELEPSAELSMRDAPGRVMRQVKRTLGYNQTALRKIKAEKGARCLEATEEKPNDKPSEDDKKKAS